MVWEAPEGGLGLEETLFLCQRTVRLSREGQSQAPSPTRDGWAPPASASHRSLARRRGCGMEERTWAGGKEPGRTLSHPQGARAAAAMVTSASCLIHLKQQKGGGAGSQLGPPLRGAVYNSRMWDSQKETPNRTSCGCKIPRCQELKIAALGPQARGKGHAHCGGGQPACGLPSSLLRGPWL